MAEYTRRSLPEKAVLSSCSPNDRRDQKAKSGRVVRKVCHYGSRNGRYANRDGAIRAIKVVGGKWKLK